MNRINKQKGFTIIELVVVILLLGILTATALPRFMDVTDQAHDAVVDGVLGGMATASGLFHAQWYAEKQPNTVSAAYGSLGANSAGYPVGTTDNTLDETADCVAIFGVYLQAGGRPTITSIAASTSALATADITTAVSTADFVSYLDTTGEGTCYYAYTGQFTDGATNSNIPQIIYDTSTGTIQLGTEL